AHAAPAAGRNDVRRAAALHHHPQQRFPADGRARGHSAPHAGHRRHPREAGTLPRAVGNSTARPARMDKGGTCMKILIDARRGENAPLCVLQGAAQAAAEFGDGMTLALLGDEQALRDCAAANKIDLSPFEIIPCTEVIDMHDDPVKAARHKTDSSMVKGLTMLKNGEGDAFVSAGSTGALHVATSLIVRTLKGIKRPALATPMPGAKQDLLLLDCGANAECRAEMLNAFGTMGSVYAQKVMGRAQPQVALVNNGAEDTKGTPIYREAHQLLKANPCIRFAGNIEPRYIMDGDID